MTDTTPEMAARYHEMLMALTPAERFAMGLRMCGTAREIVVGSFAEGMSESERRLELLRRYYAADLGEVGVSEVAAALY